MVIWKALASVLVTSLLAILPACSPSCVDRLGMSDRLGDVEYHLDALNILLKSDSPDFTKVGQEQARLSSAIDEVADGLRDSAPVEANGFREAAKLFWGSEKNLQKLRLAVQELPTAMKELEDELQAKNQYCNVS